MKSFIARFLSRFYSVFPLKSLLLKLCSRLEGGHLRSMTLRRLLRQYHGVEVGMYTYGSLLEPGRADPYTQIGRYVSIGPDVRRLGAAHPMHELSLHPYWYNPALGRVEADSDVARSSIIIESDAWLGAGSIILPGCTRIGFGAVVGAGSVVTRDVEDFSVVAGSPAREISKRLTPALRRLLLSTRPWDLEPDEFQKFLEEMATGHDIHRR